MSLAMMVWALKKDLKNSEFRILLNIANEADSDGICYTGQKKLAARSGLSIRTVKSSIGGLRQKDLLHTERRPAEFARGRHVDAIILHPEVDRWDIPETEDLEEIEHNRQLRKRFECNDEAHVSASQTQGAKFAPSDETAGNVQGAKFAPRDISPSQTQGANFAPKDPDSTSKVQKCDVQGANLSTNSEAALKGTRARLTRINPVIDQSVSQSATSSTGAKMQTPATPVTDGLMTDSSQDLKNDSICGVPTSLLLRQLRHGLTRYRNVSTEGISDDQLLVAVEEVLSRTDRTQVSNPVGFCVGVIGNEAGGLAAIIDLAESKARYRRFQAQAEDERAKIEAQAARLLICPTHGTQYPAGAECSSCVADRKVAPPVEAATDQAEVIYGPDGQPLRGLALIKARREARHQHA